MSIKYKSSLFLILGLLGMLISNTSVSALTNENQYINPNGIILTKKEFDFVSEFYGEDYFYSMTQEDYNWIQDLNINTSDIEIKSAYDFNSITKGISFADINKKITIAKSCNTICTIMVKATWLKNPPVKSFDVIGARLHNTSFASQTVSTKVSSSAGTEYFDNTSWYSNGVGTSIKLPDSGVNISIEQKFYTLTGGTVYATYQHATKNISLATSRSYLINSNGYGRVFSFYGDAIDVYDAMNGVDINV